MSERASPYGYYDPEPALPLERPLCLIGFLGSESSSVAALLSSLTGQPLIDLDDWVEHEAGQSISALCQARGDAAWRALELRGLNKALKAQRPSIISLGDGALLSSEAQRLLKRSGARLIYIERPLPVLYQNFLQLRQTSPSRFPYWSRRAPSGQEELEPLLSARLRAYQEADLRLTAQDEPPLSLARSLAARLSPAGPRLSLRVVPADERVSVRGDH